MKAPAFLHSRCDGQAVYSRDCHRFHHPWQEEHKARCRDPEVPLSLRFTCQGSSDSAPSTKQDIRRCAILPSFLTAGKRGVPRADRKGPGHTGPCRQLGLQTSCLESSGLQPWSFLSTLTQSKWTDRESPWGGVSCTAGEQGRRQGKAVEELI